MARNVPFLLAFLCFTFTTIGEGISQNHQGSKGGDAPVAQQQPSKQEVAAASKLYQEGQAHFRAARFGSAAQQFKKSFALDGKPKTLFAWAQAERLSLSCATAKELYERFLEHEKSKKNREAVKKLIELCKEPTNNTEKEAENKDTTFGHDLPPADHGDGKPALAADLRTEADETRVTPSHDTPSTTPWYGDLILDSLLIGGSVGVGVGVGFWASSRSALKSAESEMQSHSEAETQYNQAKSRQTLAIISGSVGAALFAGAIVRVVTRKPQNESLRVGARLQSDQAGFWVSGAF